MYNNNFNQRYSQSQRSTNQQPGNNSKQRNPISNSENSFEDNPKLKSIDPVKMRIINEIKRQSKTKTTEELIPEIMKINQELNRRNMNFTKEETALLMDAIEESLNPADKKKFQMLKGFF